ncbi:MAG: phosphatidylserine decarboxylase [Gemmatimonadales bacterium]|nr:MAG: phosphatidylserine decarboxylase [Gemmatimonadales bacterium]
MTSVPHVSRRWKVALAVLKRLPQGPISGFTGWLASRRIPHPMRPAVIGAFVRATGIDLSEAVGRKKDFPSVSACFTRALKPDARSWPAEEGVPASPVDGVVGACGRIEDELLVQAKGIEYRLEELLALGRGDEARAERWNGGHFFTLYLSPRHYHRIHSPVTGTVTRSEAVPGRLLPVNEPAVASIPRLFSTNARRILELETEWGRAPGRRSSVALVAVGAFNVGRITLTGPVAPGLEVARGREVARFDLGSTVVLLLGPEAGDIPRARGVRAGRPIRLGDPLLAGPVPGPSTPA